MSESTDDGSEDGQTISRRGLVASVAGVGVLGASIGYGAGNASAQATGTVGAENNPYLKAYIDRRVWVGRTSDPSSPAEGTEIYRSDL